MSFNGSGVFVINSAGQPVVAATLITAAAMNALTADLATGLSACVLKDGTQTITQNIPFNDKKITGLGAASARTDAASIATIQDGTGVYVATVGGTANAITLTPSPAITAYVAGQTFRFLASGPNTTSVTVEVSGLGVVALGKNASTVLAANDIPATNAMVEIVCQGSFFLLMSVRRDFATLTGTETLTNKTLTAPVLSGTVTGTYTLGGTPTITAPALSGTVTGTYTLGGTPTISAPVLSGTVTGTYTLGGTPTIPGALIAGTGVTQNPWAASTQTTAAHGLGAYPALIIAYVECLTAEGNYSIGDRVFMPADSGSARGFSTYSSTTTVGVTTDSGPFTLVNKTTGAGFVPTLANWKLVVTPYRLQT